MYGRKKAQEAQNITVSMDESENNELSHEVDTPELREFLLEAIEGPHQPFRFNELIEMGERILAEKRKNG